MLYTFAKNFDLKKLSAGDEIDIPGSMIDSVVNEIPDFQVRFRKVSDRAELRKSLLENGQRQRVQFTLTPQKDRLILLAGFHRTDEIKALNAGERKSDPLPLKGVIVEAKNALHGVLVGLDENLIRADMTVMDKAHAFQLLVDRKMKQGDIATRYNLTEGRVSQLLKLTKLPAVLQNAIHEGLPESAVRVSSLVNGKTTKLADMSESDIKRVLDMAQADADRKLGFKNPLDMGKRENIKADVLTMALSTFISGQEKVQSAENGKGAETTPQAPTASTETKAPEPRLSTGPDNTVVDTETGKTLTADQEKEAGIKRDAEGKIVEGPNSITGKLPPSSTGAVAKVTLFGTEHEYPSELPCVAKFGKLEARRGYGEVLMLISDSRKHATEGTPEAKFWDAFIGYLMCTPGIDRMAIERHLSNVAKGSEPIGEPKKAKTTTPPTTKAKGKSKAA